MISSPDIDSLLRPLGQKPTQAYISSAVQIADLLEWILRQLGAGGGVEIWQTSFSVSEEFLRRLYFIRRRHNVRRVSLLLDRKATNKTISLWIFIRRVFDSASLADNHSKVLLVRADDGRTVSVVTSQNLTRGNRAESTVVSTDTEIFNVLLSQVEDIVINHSVPLSELLRSRADPD